MPTSDVIVRDSRNGSLRPEHIAHSSNGGPALELDLKVHLWTHELLGRGGIQAYSRHLLEALQMAVGPKNVQVFSKNDPSRQLKAVAQCSRKGSGSFPRLLRSAVFAFQVCAQALKDRPDLVILSHLNLSPVACWLTSVARIPYWCIAHGVEAWGLKRRDRVRGFRAASRILAVSSYTRDRVLKEQQLSSGRVSILPNTFRPGVFRPGPKTEVLLRRHAISPNKKVILTVARLARPEKYKGYEQLVRALPQIIAAIPDAHYVLVGEGQDRERIEQLIASLRLNHSVTLTGAVTDTELPEYYNLCDVFAMPSKGEGFGIVYLEALSCGKPVLAGNVDGSVHPLQNGQLGVLVNPDSVAEIAESLVAILNGTYPLPVLYQPKELRERTIQAFGPERFFNDLKRNLEGFQIKRPAGERKCRRA